ncbi:hypothetical protein [Neorhizobium galegae]|uniref:hypothetical protein n=1 Tax=Neorhizobium galegae TaxID=399 RepID=UPI00059E3832|nr:hypothetical protein [Neorhizobium galegae]MCQ1854584.1 hypothetical protein [Neorhizobium galegae]
MLVIVELLDDQTGGLHQQASQSCYRLLAVLVAGPSSVRGLNIRSSYRPDAGTSALRDLIV